LKQRPKSEESSQVWSKSNKQGAREGEIIVHCNSGRVKNSNETIQHGTWKPALYKEYLVCYDCQKTKEETQEEKHACKINGKRKMKKQNKQTNKTT